MARVNRKQKPEPVRGNVPRPSWIVGGLAVMGVLDAGYLSWLKQSGASAALCTAGSGCDIVQASRYSLFLGVPTALWGLVVFAFIGGLALTGFGWRRWLAAFLLASGGVGFSVYLTALAVFGLGATCIWCLTSAAILIVLVVALWSARPTPSGRKPAVRPPKLAVYGILAALGTAVVGAFVFAAPISAPAGYSSALARHLADTRAVMYGAFW
jgi:uncharacterized membrane protein